MDFVQSHMGKNTYIITSCATACDSSALDYGLVKSRKDFLELYVDIAGSEDVPLLVRSVALNSPCLASTSIAHASPVGNIYEGDENDPTWVMHDDNDNDDDENIAMEECLLVEDASASERYEGGDMDASEITGTMLLFLFGKEFCITYILIVVIGANKNHALMVRFQDRDQYKVRGNWVTSCLWRVRAIKPVFGKNWKITRWSGDHNYLNDHISQGHKQLDADIIAELVLWMIREEPSVSIALVQEKITFKHGFKVSYRKAWYAKQEGIIIMYGDLDESQCCKAFKFAKLVIQIDGTHSYGKYKGKLLVATAQDGNEKCLPIAFAIVEGETLEAWDYFLVNIRAHVTEMSNICIISDQHRNIISAVENNRNWQPPNAYHVFCIRHIANDFNQKFRNDRLKRTLKNLGYTPSMVDFERGLARLCEASPQVAEWIDAIPNEKWSCAYDVEGRRYVEIYSLTLVICATNVEFIKALDTHTL
ncbi:uncharacterized protein LOC133293144 [Gastrolobium bilobum]|uniref:uncharacterized protein LOC133293144 n=1 Tax=Gastrolobium bilobum TaxID=150636 RepID=UPI002AB1DA4E|nr:uncharacterized protein LOC133293144 [Gastrolobium bilobum]